ncbi:phenylacetate--CoA ligase family protein, partial [Parapedobacter sp.]
MTIPPIEQATRAAVNRFQEEKLQRLMVYLQANSAHYQQVFRTHGIDVYGVRTLGDLAQLPFTTKEQLQRDNAAFRCVATSQAADYVTTSGTSGDPVLLALTDRDLDRLAYNESLSYQCMGMAAGQAVQLTTTLDRRFMA